MSSKDWNMLVDYKVERQVKYARPDSSGACCCYIQYIIYNKENLTATIHPTLYNQEYSDCCAIRKFGVYGGRVWNRQATRFVAKNKLE